MLISLVAGLFLFLEKDFSVRGYFPPRNWHFAPFGQEGFSFPDLALCKSHLFLLKMLITATTSATVPVFAVLIVVSSALVVPLEAVAVT
jgi:hypothetical protein